METDVITQYVLAIAPAVTAIVTMIATIVVSIKKMKTMTDDHYQHLNKINVLTYSLMEENRELKAAIRKNINKISTLDEVIDKRRE